MGRQLRFFHTQVAEARILEMAQTLGLTVFPTGIPSQLALGYAQPPRVRIFAQEFIQFSRPRPETHSGQLYFHPYKTDISKKSPQICDAYETLVKTIKKQSYYSREKDLWIFKDLQEEFEAIFYKTRSSEPSKRVSQFRRSSLPGVIGKENFAAK
ncbi:hypothetical protein [Thermocoleostomius sinensis]|uniref:Uncharacterized protein n=1 Tax=Thermocoleostomius sinensis A174 TaxID=2016057 RepID=A0A9E8ZG33_9CYAN|nr:hypothetical protein [Thermocoleostomius sinensis]WAL62488.1 hypothetical protein OXH18_10995 [Thermocoleostomius sinensis A174]